MPNRSTEEIAQLRRLEEAVNGALFELHDYLRKIEGEEGQWRSVYGMRCDVARIAVNTANRWAGK